MFYANKLNFIRYLNKALFPIRVGKNNLYWELISKLLKKFFPLPQVPTFIGNSALIIKIAIYIISIFYIAIYLLQINKVCALQKTYSIQFNSGVGYCVEQVGYEYAQQREHT